MNQPSLEKEESDSFTIFVKQFEELEPIVEKLRCAIEFMRNSLSNTLGTPYFKGFWEARKLCLPLFKEQITQPLRSQLWGEYVELTREGRRLKNILDEESAFAVEQIEMAIKSLEEEIEKFKANAHEVEQATALPRLSKVLEEKIPFYETSQNRLSLLNVYASRIHALRKELIKTEMRIRHKNRFFERLSSLGDAVFPVRKDLINEVSTHFTQDIASFVTVYFSDETFCPDEAKRQVFYYREEIKALQALAKMLTLSSHAFTTTREHLSASWDKLKGLEKELKKEFTEQRAVSQENVTAVLAKLKELETLYLEEKAVAEEILKEYDGVARWMRELDLTHTDVKHLKEELRRCRQAPEKKIEDVEATRRQKAAQEEADRRQECAVFKERIEALKEKKSALSVQELESEWEALRAEIHTKPFAKKDKQCVERVLKEIKDTLEEKKEDALMNLSEGDKEALSNLKEVLQQRKDRRQEIKVLVEEYRKIMGGSSLDFEKAIEYGDLMAKEKERLEKMDESIREIEDKIAQLKKKV